MRNKQAQQTYTKHIKQHANGHIQKNTTETHPYTKTHNI